MEQNGMFLENFEYDHQILHKKSGWDEIYTIFHEIAHISLNIGHRISNPETLKYPFPLAVHYVLIRQYITDVDMLQRTRSEILSKLLITKHVT